MTKPQSRIPYAVIRSRRSTADIVIERDGQVVVRAPEWADDDCVAHIVDSKAYWIHRTLAEWRELNVSRVVREFKNGEGFPYLGRSYRLQLVDNPKQPLQLKDGQFKLGRSLAEDDGKAAQEAFRAFYTARGIGRLRERVLYFAPKAGVQPTDVEVCELGHRWASCSPRGKVAFHWKCMMAPQTIIDYIVVHELCHLHHRDHTSAFWNEVDKIMPDFVERKAWLAKNGASLDL